MTSRRVLLVSPVFHGYWSAIAGALQARGHEVTVHCYDAPVSLRGRVENKLIHDLPERWRRTAAADSMTDRAVTALRNVRPDVIIVVKGDQLGSDWWNEVDRSGAARVTWFYDELRRMRYSAEDLLRIGPIASYSPLDVASLTEMGARAQHVPLAYDSRISRIAQTQQLITFVGARYPSRQDVLQRLYRAGVPVRAYGKTWSRRPLDVLRTRQFSHPGIPAGPDLNRQAAYGIMEGSSATINVPGDQDGFTMRTFEASGVGALQLVDRSDVQRHYAVGSEVLVFDSFDELLHYSRRALRDTAWAANIRAAGRRRTMAEHTFDHRARTLEQLWG